MSKWGYLSIICVILCGNLCMGETIYVRQDNSGDYNSIGYALNAADDGDVIVVGNGIWAGDSNMNIDSWPSSIILMSEHGNENCIIDGEGGYKAFYVDGSSDSVITIKGFTFRNCYSGNGGVMTISHPITTIEDCVFINNETAECGGAIYCYSSNLTINNCVFENNVGYCGAAIGYLNYREYYEGKLTIIGSEFYDNTSWDNAGAVYYNSYAGESTISDCVFDNNFALEYGGAIMGSGNGLTIDGCQFNANMANYGGVLYTGDYMEESLWTIANCKLMSNLANTGGGLYLGGGIEIEIFNTELVNNKSFGKGGGILCSNCQSMDITNCLFANNVSGTYGAAIGGTGGSEVGTGDIINCTFVGNKANDGGSVDSRYETPSRYINCIFADNSYQWWPENSSGTFTFDHCCFPEGIDHTLDVTTNIYANPLFVSGPLGDFYLSRFSSGQNELSPCIDAGRGSADDYRIGETTTSTNGIIDTGVVDLGYHYPSNCADINLDGRVDMLDLSLLSTEFGQNNKYVPEAETLGWWKFNEATGNEYVYDSSGNGFTGVMNGFEETNIWQQGVWQGALLFDGTDDYITLPNIINPVDGALSMTAWVYGGMGQAVFAQSAESGTARKWMHVSVARGILQTQLTDGQADALDGYYAFQKNKWYHVALVWDGKRRKLYVNGEQIIKDTEDLAGPLESFEGEYYIGTGSYGIGYSTFDGAMDDLKIYNQALSEQEIANMYAEGMYYETAWWKFEEGLGTVAQCSVNSNNDGTLVNMDADSWCDGKFGRALYFDGVDDYVETNFILDPSDGPFSAFAWIKFEDIENARDGRIISQQDNGYAWLMLDNNGCLCTALRCPTSSGTDTIYKPDENEWVHVGVVYDGQALSLYANCQLLAQENLDYPLLSCTQGLYLGTRPSASDGYWCGYIDDVRIYHSSLSGKQIYQVYSEQNPMATEYLCNKTIETDINKDCVVDLNDVMLMAARWLK